MHAHGHTHAPGGSDEVFTDYGIMPDSVIEPFPWWACSTNAALTSGAVYLSFLRARRNQRVTKMAYSTRGTNSSGLTLARLGLFTFDGTSILLVARTASDTTLGNTANTDYTKSFDTTGGYPASYDLERGMRYALGVILVGTTPGNAPQLGVGATAGMAARGGVRRYDAQADLPTSAVALTSLAQPSSPFYLALLES